MLLGFNAYMQTVYNNNVSFGTNIYFISHRGMARIVKKMKKSPEYDQIDAWRIRPYEGDKSTLGYRTDCSLGYTYGVRSCSSGVSVKRGGKARYFWHIEDTYNNVKHLKVIRGLTNCDNVILFGSKTKYKLSKNLFKRFESFINKDNVPATILGGLSLHWQIDAAYISKTDTLFLCVTKIPLSISQRVDSMKKLKEVFEKIKISPTDKLKFPNFLQEFFMITKLKIEK